MSSKLNSKGKLVMAVSSVLTSVVVLGMASFAWMTMSTKPEAKGMQFLVGADDATLISTDSKNFYSVVDLSETFNTEISELKPVSTIDGLNWFVCDYTNKGDVVEDKFVLLNWCKDSNHYKVGATHNHCDNGFYAYTDIWVKTDADKAAIRLSVPHDERFTNSQLNHKDYEESSGSYVLSFDYVELEGKNDKGETVTNKGVKVLRQGPETCARVGMLIYPPVDSEDENYKPVDENYPNVVLKETQDPREIWDEENPENNPVFYIYEPNADSRSELDKQDKEYKTDTYISGLDMQSQSVTTGDKVVESGGMPEGFYRGSEGKYIPTYPIMAKEESEPEPEPELEPEPEPVDGEEPNPDVTPSPSPTAKPHPTGGKVIEAGPAVFPPERLIVQTSTTWNEMTIDEEASAEATAETNPKLSYVDNMKYLKVNEKLTELIDNLMLNKFINLGGFYSEDLIKTKFYKEENQLQHVTGGNQDYILEGIDYRTIEEDSASQVIFELERDEVRQIRLYFWIEGQDVDCWNDVSGMNFLVRLEFATTILE